MYSISICDRIKKSRDSLEKILICYFKAKDVLVEIRKYESIHDMMTLSSESDILFLDEDTLTMQGIELSMLPIICKPHICLYILGGKNKQTEEAAKMYAFRYLEKPVNLDKLYLTLNAILDTQKKVSFTSDYLPVTLKEDAIVCICSFNRKTYVVADTGIVYPTTISIKKWKQKVKDFKGFCHPHYSYIINLRYICSFDGKTIELGMKRGKKIKIIPSQRRIADFRNDYYTREDLLRIPPFNTIR